MFHCDVGVLLHVLHTLSILQVDMIFFLSTSNSSWFSKNSALEPTNVNNSKAHASDLMLFQHLFGVIVGLEFQILHIIGWFVSSISILLVFNGFGRLGVAVCTFGFP